MKLLRPSVKRSAIVIGLMLVQWFSSTAESFAQNQPPSNPPGQAPAAPLPQPRVWPESNIKIDPEDIRRQVLDKLNAAARGMYFLQPAPPSGFPVPIPPDVSNAIYTTKGPVVSGSMKTKDSPESLIRWYKQAVAQRGFNVMDHARSKAEDSGHCGVITATKSDTNANTTTNLTISVIQPAADYSMLSITSITMPTPKPEPK